MADSRDLVQDASRGDARAVEALLERYLPDLRRFVRRRAGAALLSKESGSDLVQSVCRELLQGLADQRFAYRGEKEFRHWLYGAALLKLEGRARHWRAERRDVARELPLDGASDAGSRVGPADPATPSSHAAAGEEVELLHAALARLPERYREIVELAYVECLSHREIAARLSISETNSRALLSRAVARLATLGAQLRG